MNGLRRAWQRSSAWQTALACWLGALGCLLGAVDGWAYRPFVSTDAAVADPQAAEIELGYFTLEHARGEQTFTLPSLVLNYGLWRDLEVVGEFAVARDPAGDLNLVDPGLFAKAVLKEGVLQEKEGLSVAVERVLVARGGSVYASDYALPMSTPCGEKRHRGHLLSTLRDATWPRITHHLRRDGA